MSDLDHEDNRNQPCALRDRDGSNAEVRQEAAMSSINGDKSRANRQRKQNIQRRLRDLALAHTEAVKPNQASAPKKAKSAIHPEPTAP
jgi:hypothetical protein